MTWRKAFTVSTEGDEAVKNFGSAGGNGSTGAAGGAILGRANGLGGVEEGACGAGAAGAATGACASATAAPKLRMMASVAGTRPGTEFDIETMLFKMDSFFLGFCFGCVIWCSIYSIEAGALRPVNCRSIAQLF
jgi:hypothetical protein